MIIETRDVGEKRQGNVIESAKVHAKIVDGDAGGWLTAPRHENEEREETHAAAARRLADRPAVRVIEETPEGFTFEA